MTMHEVAESEMKLYQALLFLAYLMFYYCLYIKLVHICTCKYNAHVLHISVFYRYKGAKSKM